MQAAIQVIRGEIAKCQNYHAGCYHDIAHWREKGLTHARHVQDMQNGQALIFKRIDELRDALRLLEAVI